MAEQINLKISPSYVLYNDVHLLAKVDATTEEMNKINNAIQRYNLKEEYTDDAILAINQEGKLKEIEKRIDKLLDNKAQSMGYDNINSIAKYIGYDNVFRTECEALGEWCANTWAYCYQELGKIQNGLRSEPTIDEFLAELPQFTI